MSNGTQSIRVLSIDPGYDRCGLAILEKKSGSKDVLLASFCEQTQSSQKFSDRLFQVASKIEALISEYRPSHIAIETLFFSNNKTTAMHVAEVRGAIIFLAKKHDIQIKELNPNEIKLAVTGDGRSTKQQMIKMIQLITGYRDKVKDDEYDAIAVGIAFLVLYREGITQLD